MGGCGGDGGKKILKSSRFFSARKFTLCSKENYANLEIRL